tara:strand:+ start:981 stop:2024 length:1044 start_codon:yes stop_codon:yes gene_type:complete
MAYTTVDNPTDYFNTVLFSGNETARSITGVGFQPDWVWIKDRSQAYNHHLFDSVRGATKRLKSDVADAQSTNAQTLTAFGSDGFSLGTDNATNGNGSSVVSWNWLAGTSFSNDASATSVGSIDSTGSTNSTAGFSIVKYTGTGSSATVAHNLGAVPHFMLFKSMDASENWVVYHQSNGAGGYIYLNNTAAAGSGNTSIFGNTNPTSSVFTINTDGNINNSSDDYIAYCFTEKQGYSKFGSYTGNGDADGPFVYTGFKPAWVLQKNAGATQGWQLQDNKREGYNGDNDLLQPHDSAAESGVNRIDILSNGFKVITTDAGQNSSGTKYIYMCFAESPFVSSSGIPTTAR